MKKVWIDLFEFPHLRGRCRRLPGPELYNNLRQSTTNFGVPAESLAAGPSAFVRLFDAKSPSETIWWMRPNSIVDAIGTISDGDRINSLELSDGPPVKGAIGYEIFQRFAASADGH